MNYLNDILNSSIKKEIDKQQNASPKDQCFLFQENLKHFILTGDESDKAKITDFINHKGDSVFIPFFQDLAKSHKFVFLSNCFQVSGHKTIAYDQAYFNAQRVDFCLDVMNRLSVLIHRHLPTYLPINRFAKILAHSLQTYGAQENSYNFIKLPNNLIRSHESSKDEFDAFYLALYKSGEFLKSHQIDGETKSDLFNFSVAEVIGNHMEILGTQIPQLAFLEMIYFYQSDFLENNADLIADFKSHLAIHIKNNPDFLIALEHYELEQNIASTGKIGKSAFQTHKI